MSITENYSYEDEQRDAQATSLKGYKIFPFSLKNQTEMSPQERNVKHMISFLSNGIPLTFVNVKAPAFGQYGENFLCKSSALVTKIFGTDSYCELQASGKQATFYNIYPIVHWTNAYNDSNGVFTVKPQFSYLRLTKQKSAVLAQQRISLLKEFVVSQKLETPDSFDSKFGSMDWLQIASSGAYSQEVLSKATLLNKVWGVNRTGTGATTQYNFVLDRARGTNIDLTAKLNEFTEQTNDSGNLYKLYTIRGSRKFPKAELGSLLETVYQNPRFANYKDADVNWASVEHAELFYLFYFMATGSDIYSAYGKSRDGGNKVAPGVIPNPGLDFGFSHNPGVAPNSPLDTPPASSSDFIF